MEKLNCSVYDVSESVEDLISEGAVVPLFISGSSMNPFLVSRRDIVYLKSCTETELKKNSIVLFKRNDGVPVLHRIRKVLKNGTLLMCGDAQTWTETVSANQVIATVSEIERKGKRKSANCFYWKLINCIWSLVLPFRSIIMRIWFKINRIKNNNHSE